MDFDPDHDDRSDSEPVSECCKVGRTSLSFDVPDAAREIASRRRDGESYRDLAEYFNVRLVERALERADVDSGRSVHAALVAGDVAAEVYRILRSGGGSDIRRAELRARLADAGVDVEQLESAFVSHVTIRSHLTECADVDARESPPSFEQTVNTTQWARTRASNVIQSTLDRAVEYDQLRTGPLEAELFVRVTCDECGESYYLAELLDSRTCSCQDTG
ncbi:rod-determining factor RdfA [Natrarchaeobius oligotrophus]|uniref:Uncharacterized protein n=1 Tax=Natrarchaeobius chitinivorans TaxID=1679083 RepID=A0A3N6MNZ0_NATCH|nr:rod-determining factor RdfA [Natrarchaeobius chitinivorans]RQG99240.1 hypothetical protein EA472_15380 [Natrarchaeobius chitinivorans]